MICILKILLQLTLLPPFFEITKSPVNTRVHTKTTMQSTGAREEAYTTGFVTASRQPPHGVVRLRCGSGENAIEIRV